MDNIIIISILIMIIGSVSFYIYQEKKKGTTCIGCPYAKQCASVRDKNHLKKCAKS